MCPEVVSGFKSLPPAIGFHRPKLGFSRPNHRASGDKQSVRLKLILIALKRLP